MSISRLLKQNNKKIKPQRILLKKANIIENKSIATKM